MHLSYVTRDLVWSSLASLVRPTGSSRVRRALGIESGIESSARACAGFWFLVFQVCVTRLAQKHASRRRVVQIMKKASDRSIDRYSSPPTTRLPDRPNPKAKPKPIQRSKPSKQTARQSSRDASRVHVAAAIYRCAAFVSACAAMLPTGRACTVCCLYGVASHGIRSVGWLLSSLVLLALGSWLSSLVSRFLVLGSWFLALDDNGEATRGKKHCWLSIAE